jgi:two-component system, chemotaxis family, sensor kinase CheA
LNKLQRSVMKIRMVPVEQLFRRFPRVVRDVSKLQNKEVALVLEGETTDLDKTILDALAEPMTHLVRNAVDHGIEPPEQRIAAGKPAQGTIKLNAYHQGNQVVIEISDDGKGIDKEKVVAKAIERGLLKPEDAARLNETEVLNLIFHAGLSTADQVTNISGRGVGMDIVLAAIDRLKGTVVIQTEAGVGTTFRLRLPLTLAIIRALLFHVNAHLYAVPLGSVLEIARAAESDIHMVDNHEVLQLREEVITLVRLSDLVKGQQARRGKKLFIIVVAMAGRKFGLVVDKLQGEEELVIKALDDQVVSTDLVSGASILGDGTVVLILNISAVVERLGRAATVGSTGRKAVGAPA